jgi:hypothetical protein
MKNFEWAEVLPGALRARQPPKDAVSAFSQRLLRALSGLHHCGRRSAASSRRYESVRHLDHRVLEEIGLTREQVRHDATQPVWWR